MNPLINYIFTEINKIRIDISYLNQSMILFKEFNNISFYCSNIYIKSLIYWSDKKSSIVEANKFYSEQITQNESIITQESRDTIKRSIEELEKIVEETEDVIQNIQNITIKLTNIIKDIKNRAFSRELIKDEIIDVYAYSSSYQSLSSQNQNDIMENTIISEEKFYEILKRSIANIYPKAFIDINFYIALHKLYNSQIIQKTPKIYQGINLVKIPNIIRDEFCEELTKIIINLYPQADPKSIEFNNILHQSYDSLIIQENTLTKSCLEQKSTLVITPLISEQEYYKELNKIIIELYPQARTTCIDLNNALHKLKHLMDSEHILQKFMSLQDAINKDKQDYLLDYSSELGITPIDYPIDYKPDFTSTNDIDINICIPNSSKTAEQILKNLYSRYAKIEAYLQPLFKPHDKPNESINTDKSEFHVPEELKHYLIIEDKSPEILQNTEATSSIISNINTDIFKSMDVN